MPRTGAPHAVLAPSARRARRKFLDYFPDGFRDETYVETERAYKWDAHVRWRAALGRDRFAALLAGGEFGAIADAAVRIESRTNLLFSFEKMAIRDAVSTPPGAERFAAGLYDWLHGPGGEQARFDRWIDVLQGLPRRQTRVATWPSATVFGFLARPKVHLFLKPTVTRAAAEAYGYDFRYESGLSWSTYASALDFARRVRRDMADLQPRDLIDVQGFLWVQGSAEYE